jgi:virginiamycin B lyase
MRTCAIQLTLLTCAAAVLCCGGAAPSRVAQFAVPIPAETSRVQPQAIVAAPDGNVWFTVSWLTADNRLRGVVARAAPSGAITLFDGPQVHDAGGIAIGTDGDIWFTDVIGIGRMTPAGDVTTFGLPPSGATAVSIAAASDGSFWFTENVDRLGNLRPDGTFSEYSLPHPNSGVEGIAVAGASVWFVESSLNAIGRLTSDGAVAEFPIPTPSSGARAIVASADGSLWFSESQAGKIGHITSDGRIDEHTLGGTAEVSTPLGLATDSNGNIWFADLNDKIGMIAANGDFTEVALPAGSAPNWVAADAQGHVWASEAGSGSIAELSQSR